MTELVDKRGRPRVVVTGLGALSPCGTGAAATWEAVKNGVSGVSAITLFDASSVPTKIAAEVKDFDASRWLDAKESRRFDRFIHFAIAAGDLAMEDAGYKISERDAPRVGVIHRYGNWRSRFYRKVLRSCKRERPKEDLALFYPGRESPTWPQVWFRFGMVRRVPIGHLFPPARLARMPSVRGWR